MNMIGSKGASNGMGKQKRKSQKQTLTGSLCQFRHCEAALGSESVCSAWREGKCLLPHCKSRHMEIQKPRGILPCFWENQPVGCVKINCYFHHSKPRCINGLFLPPSDNNVSKTEPQEGIVHLTITEILLKNAESISRPIHPPLIITIDLDEDEDGEHEQDAENSGDSIPRTQTPEEIEEEKAIKEMCCKSGEIYKLHLPEEDLSTKFLINSSLETKLHKPMETGIDLQEGDGLAVPTKFATCGRQGKALVSYDGKAKVDLRPFEKGGGDCYVPRRNLFVKMEERKTLIQENEFISSKHPDSRGKDGRKTFKKRFFEHIGNKTPIELDSQRPSSTLPRAPSGRPKIKGVFQNNKWAKTPTDKDMSGMPLAHKVTVKSPQSIPSTPAVSPARVSNTVSTVPPVTPTKLKENPSPPVTNIDPAMKQNCKRVRKKQWTYEEHKQPPHSPTEKDVLIRNSKGKAGSHRFEERNDQNKTVPNPYYNPALKSAVRNTRQKSFIPNKPSPALNATNMKVKIAEESSFDAPTEQPASMPNTTPRWRKRIITTTPTSKMDKTYNDNYYPPAYVAPAWRKRVPYTKTEPKPENLHTERRRNGSK
ncbi:uncharacterized protein C12orf50 homolog isoform X3 [Ambystoma mexicanum]|uniref:uncharacterized protein C12orf50 homolog isoform X3 n=1 Tax=Ambystoma mexicanum TaxID=8296 RepID=UPI0037E9A4CB